MRTGIMALEELNTEEGNTPEVTDFVDAPETEMLQAEEASGELARHEDSVDEAAQVADTVEAVADRVGETIPEGGLSEPEAAAVEVAVEHMLQRVGFSAKKSKVAALESFKDVASRKVATESMVENVRAKAKQIWEAIVAALSKAWEWIKNLLDFSGKAAAKTVARAEQLKAAAEKSDAKGGDKIAGESLLVEGGKALSGSALVKAYGQHVSSNVVKVDRLDHAKKVYGEIKPITAKADPKAWDDAAMIISTRPLEFLDLQNEGAKKVEKPDFSLSEGQEAFEVKLAIGDVSLFTVVSSGQKDTGVVARLTGFGASKSFIGKSTGAKGGETGEHLSASAKEAIALAEEVAGHMKTYEGLSGKITSVENESKAVLSEIKKFSNGQDEAAVQCLREASGVLRGATNVLVTGSAQLRKFDIQLANQVLSYAAKSIKAPAAQKSEDKKAA